MFLYKNSIVFFLKWVGILLITRYINFNFMIPIHVILGCISLVYYLMLKINNKSISFITILRKSREFKGLLILIGVIGILEIISYNIFYINSFDKLKIGFGSILPNMILFQLFNCVIEEVLFRVILTEELNSKNTFNKYSIFFTSIVFGLYHVVLANDTSNIYMLISYFNGTFLAGIGLATIYINTKKNYIYVVIIHTIYNIIQNCISIQFDTNSISDIKVIILHLYLGGVFILSSLIHKRLIKMSSKA